jgi:voltage-gated potassium channel
MDARSERVARRFEPWLLVAALLVIPVIVVEQSELANPWSTIAAVLNWVIWLAFLAEAVTMLSVVPSRRQWLREHPLEVAIVVLTPPFLPALLQGFRVARLLRLLRLLRVARVATSSKRIFTLTGLRWAGLVGVLVILGGGAAFTAVENDQSLSAWDGLWWAFTTATTVGYGDLYPRTDAGRVIAMLVMATGIGFIALFTGAIAERFVRPDVDRATAELEADEAAILAEVTEIQARLARLETLLQRRSSI